MSDWSDSAGQSDSESATCIDLTLDDSDEGKPAHKPVVRWKSDLIQCLNDIQSAGDYAIHQHYVRFPNPGLLIEGESIITPLPLVPRDAEVIKSLCSQSPFGKGDQTLIDTNVRKTWELNSSQFKLANPEWPTFLHGEILQRVCTGLGLTNVEAKPYKLLLYEEGSFFKPHKDSEKEPGMIGTLVVCLPSEHVGGDVHLTFGTDHRALATDKTSAFDLTALAWFSDVTHEVKELTKGYRFVLTYNLIQSKHVKQSALSHQLQARKLKNILDCCPIRDSPHGKLVYPLDHLYTESSLSIQNMKGRDRAVCHALQNVSAKCGFYLLFAKMTRTTEDEEDYCGEREEYISLGTVHSCDGRVLGDGGSVEDDEILGNDIYQDRECDSEEEGEFTGNEGAASTFRYHDTVAILVPKSYLASFLPDFYVAGNDAPSKYSALFSVVVDDLSNHTDDPATRSSASTFFKLVVSTRRGPGWVIGTALKWAFELDDDPLYQEVLKSIPYGSPQLQVETLGTIAGRFVEKMTGKCEEIDWNKWIGGIYGNSCLSVFQSLSSTFAGLLPVGPWKKSFQSWIDTKVDEKLQRRYPMGLEEIRFFLAATEAIEPDKMPTRTLSILVEVGTRELLREILSVFHSRKTNPKYPMAAETFKYILVNTAPKLTLQPLDMRPIDAYSLPNESKPLTQFLAVIYQALDLGFRDEVIPLLQGTYDRMLESRDMWAAKPPGPVAPGSFGATVSSLISKLLQPLAAVLKKHGVVAPAPAVEDIFELVIRHAYHVTIGPWPRQLPGWKHQQRPCSSQCFDCGVLNEFLASEQNQEWRFRAGQDRRRHIERVLPTQLFQLRTESTGSPHTLVVTKLGKEFAEGMRERWRWIIATEAELTLLRNDYVRDILGDEKYGELVLLDKIKSSAPADAAGSGVVAGVKRPADQGLGPDVGSWKRR